ncbi:MAG: hypothetical protein ATN35_12895 [Epulopiscium sp. Nele67-Bin004]|nr:MAG: hypothetical protein ATN35_12895 [Epulopiscium sp. Nele67-Bin004]
MIIINWKKFYQRSAGMLSVVISSQVLVPTFVDIPTTKASDDTDDNTDNTETTDEANAVYSITDDGTLFFYNPENDSNFPNIIIPAEIDGIPVTAIGTLSDTTGVFEGAGVETVSIEATGIKIIGASAFKDNKITSFDIPNSLEDLGNYAFYNAFASIENYELDYTLDLSNTQLTYIPAYAFTYHPFTSMTMPSTVTTIGNYAFAYGLLHSVLLPEQLQTIYKGSFAANNLFLIPLPETLKNIVINYEFDPENPTLPSESDKNLGLGNYSILVSTEIFIPSSLITNYDFDTKTITVDAEELIKYYGLKDEDGNFIYGINTEQDIRFMGSSEKASEKGAVSSSWSTDTGGEEVFDLNATELYLPLASDYLVGNAQYPDQNRIWLSENYFGMQSDNDEIEIYQFLQETQIVGLLEDLKNQYGENTQSLVWVLADDYIAMEFATQAAWALADANNISTPDAYALVDNVPTFTLPQLFDMNIEASVFKDVVQTFAMYGGRMNYYLEISGDNLPEGEITNVNQLEPGEYFFNFTSYDFGKQWYIPEMMQTTLGGITGTTNGDEFSWTGGSFDDTTIAGQMPTVDEAIQIILDYYGYDASDFEDADRDIPSEYEIYEFTKNYTNGISTVEEITVVDGGNDTSDGDTTGFTNVVAPFSRQEYNVYAMYTTSSPYVFLDSTFAPLITSRGFKLIITPLYVPVVFDAEGGLPTPTPQVVTYMGVAIYT